MLLGPDAQPPGRAGGPPAPPGKWPVGGNFWGARGELPIEAQLDV